VQAGDLHEWYRFEHRKYAGFDVRVNLSGQ